MFLNFLDLKPCGDQDTCAYNVAKLKRNIDNIYNTGSIDRLLNKFDKEVGHTSPKLESFKDKVRYYHKNRKIKPADGDPNRYNLSLNMSTKDNDVNPQYIFGCLEIACGSLFHVLPFPGCQALGKLLIGDGCIRIGYQYYDDKNEENHERYINKQIIGNL